MKQKLIADRISRTEERPLSDRDITQLKTKRNKQLLFLLSGYLPFIAFGFYLIAVGPNSLNSGRDGLLRQKLTVNDAMTSRFWTVAPWFVAFGFIMLTIYFTRLYLQSIKPLSADIKQNKKQLLFFKPAKNPMAFFNKYYLSTPLYENQQIEISHEDLETINDSDELHIEIGPASTYIFCLCNGDKEIKYY